VDFLANIQGESDSKGDLLRKRHRQTLQWARQNFPKPTSSAALLKRTQSTWILVDPGGRKNERLETRLFFTFENECRSTLTLGLRFLDRRLVQKSIVTVTNPHSLAQGLSKG